MQKSIVIPTKKIYNAHTLLYEVFTKNNIKIKNIIVKMESNLIDFDFDVNNLKITSQPSYYELEQKIVEQDAKINLLQNKIDDILQNMSIVKEIYNNFTIEIEYIEFTKEISDFISKNMMSTTTGFVTASFFKIDKSLIKTKIIQLNSEKLNLSNVLLNSDYLFRFKSLYKLKNITLNTYTYTIYERSEGNNRYIIIGDGKHACTPSNIIGLGIIYLDSDYYKRTPPNIVLYNKK
jgi:hypothetical protein